MKAAAFIKYFFYLGLHWNWRIAFVITLQEIKGENKYGINTTGANELKKLSKKGIDISHATIYMPVSYKLLEEIFSALIDQPKNHFVDIGCGKGRALCLAAFNGYKKVTGVDFSEELCADALTNLAIMQSQNCVAAYNVITKDAAVFEIPGDADCIFLFNPFDAVIMEKVRNNILKSLNENPRMINVVYVNPLYKDLFLTSGFTENYYRKSMKYFEVSILNIRR